jgi:hypothetical protein
MSGGGVDAFVIISDVILELANVRQEEGTHTEKKGTLLADDIIVYLKYS